MSWGLESLHALLPLAGRLMGILRAVVEIPMLAVLYPRQHLLLRGPVAFQLVGNNHQRRVDQALQQLAENFFAAFLLRRRCTRISSTVPS
jgi:hypothetical protein